MQVLQASSRLRRGRSRSRRGWSFAVELDDISGCHQRAMDVAADARVHAIGNPGSDLAMVEVALAIRSGPPRGGQRPAA